MRRLSRDSVERQPFSMRNRIVNALNNWQQLGCLALSGDRFFVPKKFMRGRYMARLVFGVAKDGRAILILPNPRRSPLPMFIARLLQDYESHGALVGCAQDILDAYDIVADSAEHKRKQRTFAYREDSGYLRKPKRSQNGRREEEE